MKPNTYRGEKKPYIFTGDGCKAGYEPETKCRSCIFKATCEFRKEHLTEVQQAQDTGYQGC